jgi:hypothetical protein
MAESYITRKGGGGGEGTGPYSNWVLQDASNAKYEVYNGYDFQTNPNPNPSLRVFGQFILNNNTTKKVVITNAVFANFGIFNGPSSSFNHNSISLRANNRVSNSSLNNLSMRFFDGVFATGQVNFALIVGQRNNGHLIGSTAPWGLQFTDGNVNTGFPGTFDLRLSAYFQKHKPGVNSTVFFGGVNSSNSSNFILVSAAPPQTNIFTDLARPSSRNGSFSLLGMDAVGVTDTRGYEGIVLGEVLYSTERPIIRRYNAAGALTANLQLTDGVPVTTTSFLGVREFNSSVYYYLASPINKIYAFHANNLVKWGETQSFNNGISEFFLYNGFLYLSETTTANVNKSLKRYWPGNFVFKDESPSSFVSSFAKINQWTDGFVYLRATQNVGGTLFSSRTVKLFENNLQIASVHDLLGTTQFVFNSAYFTVETSGEYNIRYRTYDKGSLTLVSQTIFNWTNMVG